MHAVTEFQARVIMVAERDRLDGYRARARARQASREGRKKLRAMTSDQELSNSRIGRDAINSRNYSIIRTNRGGGGIRKGNHDADGRRNEIRVIRSER